METDNFTSFASPTDCMPARILVRKGGETPRTADNPVSAAEGPR